MTGVTDPRRGGKICALGQPVPVFAKPCLDDDFYNGAGYGRGKVGCILIGPCGSYFGRSGCLTFRKAYLYWRARLPLASPYFSFSFDGARFAGPHLFARLRGSVCHRGYPFLPASDTLLSECHTYRRT